MFSETELATLPFATAFSMMYSFKKDFLPVFILDFLHSF